MPLNSFVASTPHYVLMDGKRHIAPTVMPLPSGNECTPMYGFSDKSSFDKFCANSQLMLTPYPLVTFYIREQVRTASDGPMLLVVIDALGPLDPILHATTAAMLLEAQENRSTRVTVTHRLTFDQVAKAYRAEEEIHLTH